MSSKTRTKQQQSSSRSSCTGTTKAFFASAILLSAVSANDDISRSLNRLERAFQPTKQISPDRRVNLEALLEQNEQNTSNNSRQVFDGAFQEFQQEGLDQNEYWRESEHKYEPPVHDPQYHEPMPSGPVETFHQMPISQKAHPAEQKHRTYTEPRDDASFDNGPNNYYFEYPSVPKKKLDHSSQQQLQIEEEIFQAVELPLTGNIDRSSPQVQDSMALSLQKELAKRHLGHKFVKQPISSKTVLTDLNDQQAHTSTASQVTETIFDDLSIDRVLFSRQQDQKVDSNVSFLPDDDGILRTFIEKYTTMLVKDSAFMEEIPAPHFMQQSFLLHPDVLKQEQPYQNDHHRQMVDQRLQHHPDLKQLLFKAQQSHNDTTHQDSPDQEVENIVPSPGQLAGQPHDTFDIDNYYHVNQAHGLPIEEGYHHERRSYDDQDADVNEVIFDVEEGARSLGDTLGMHFRQPEELQVIHREAESAHRHAHHALTRYEPETFDLNHHDEEIHAYAEHQNYDDSHHLSDHSHHDTHGLPVHDMYGGRTFEHDPYHQEFVHGTNYELQMHQASPVIEHNSHSYHKKQPKVTPTTQTGGDKQKVTTPEATKAPQKTQGPQSVDVSTKPLTEEPKKYKPTKAQKLPTNSPYYDTYQQQPQYYQHSRQRPPTNYEDFYGQEGDTEDEYDWNYYDEEDEDYEVNGGQEWEYYDEMYVDEQQPGAGGGTYDRLQKKYGRPTHHDMSPAIPHGHFPSDPLHYGHQHASVPSKRQKSSKQQRPQKGQYQQPAYQQYQGQPSIPMAQPQRSQPQRSQPQMSPSPTPQYQTPQKPQTQQRTYQQPAPQMYQPAPPNPQSREQPKQFIPTPMTAGQQQQAPTQMTTGYPQQTRTQPARTAYSTAAAPQQQPILYMPVQAYMPSQPQQTTGYATAYPVQQKPPQRQQQQQPAPYKQPLQPQQQYAGQQAQPQQQQYSGPQTVAQPQQPQQPQQMQYSGPSTKAGPQQTQYTQPQQSRPMAQQPQQQQQQYSGPMPVASPSPQYSQQQPTSPSMAKPEPSMKPTQQQQPSQKPQQQSSPQKQMPAPPVKQQQEPIQATQAQQQPKPPQQAKQTQMPSQQQPGTTQVHHESTQETFEEHKQLQQQQPPQMQSQQESQGKQPDTSTGMQTAQDKQQQQQVQAKPQQVARQPQQPQVPTKAAEQQKSSPQQTQAQKKQQEQAGYAQYGVRGVAASTTPQQKTQKSQPEEPRGQSQQSQPKQEASQQSQQPQQLKQPSYSQPQQQSSQQPQQPAPQTAQRQTSYPQSSYPQSGYPQITYPQQEHSQSPTYQQRQPQQPSQNPHIMSPMGEEVPTSLSALIGFETPPPMPVPTYSPFQYGPQPQQPQMMQPQMMQQPGMMTPMPMYNPYMSAYQAPQTQAYMAPSPTAQPMVDVKLTPRETFPEGLVTHPYTTIPVTIDAGYLDNQRVSQNKQDTYKGGFSTTQDDFFPFEQSMLMQQRTPYEIAPFSPTGPMSPVQTKKGGKKQKKPKMSPYEKQLAKQRKQRAKKQKKGQKSYDAYDEMSMFTNDSQEQPNFEQYTEDYYPASEHYYQYYQPHDGHSEPEMHPEDQYALSHPHHSEFIYEPQINVHLDYHNYDNTSSSEAHH